MQMEQLSGGCLCGAVRIEIRGTPHRVGVCHCLDCRKTHGAIFRTFAIFPADQVVVSGTTQRYDHKGQRHFCPTCGSPLFVTQEGFDEIEIYVGLLDEPDRLRPSYELWTGRRESWLPTFDVARRYPHDREGTGRTEP